MINKRAITIIISLTFIAISIAMLLIFVLGSNNKNSNSVNKQILSCNVNNININVGDKVTEFYSINDENATVEFEMDKGGIIEIDSTRICGIKAGEVVVTIKVSNKNQNISESFLVKVYQKGYKVELIAIENCEINTNLNTLYMSGMACSFNVEVFDSLNKKVEDVKFNIYCDNTNAIVEQEMLNYILITNEACNLIINFYELNAIYEINVVLV